MTKLLDFLLVGAPRSGTTTLFNYLRHHPQLFIPRAKELPFFSDPERYAAGWSAFTNEFFAGASEDQLWGKLTPHYWDAPGVPERIRRDMPEVRLLALLRHPIDRAYSHYRFLARRGVEPRPFAEAAFDPAGPKYQHYLPLGEYGRLVRSYLQCFPREQLLVLFHEELEQEPLRVVAAVEDHLGLSTGFVPPNLGRRYNVGGTRTRLPWLIPTVRRSPLRWLWRSLPERIRRSVGRWYFFEVAPRTEPPDPLDPELHLRLCDHYRRDVQRLEKLLERRVPWPDLSY